MSLKSAARKALKTGNKALETSNKLRKDYVFDEGKVIQAVKDPSLKNIGGAALEIASVAPVGKALKAGVVADRALKAGVISERALKAHKATSPLRAAARSKLGSQITRNEIKRLGAKEYLTPRNWRGLS